MIRSFALALVAVLMSAPAQAQPQLPEYYRVSGVAQNDTLTVRSGPSVESDKIGELPPDYGPIEISATNEDRTWGRMAYFGTDGWVSMRYLTGVDLPRLTETGEHGSPTGIPVGLWCGGTEPFWSFTIDGQREVTFHDLNDPQPTRIMLDEVVVAVGLMSHPVGMLGGDGTQSRVAATIRPGYCDDGMSDTTYAMTVDLWYGTDGRGPVFFSGCCRYPLPE